jgi:hypothetical protein
MSKPRRPTFAETLRHGWKPPQRRTGVQGARGAGKARPTPVGRNGASAPTPGTARDPELAKQRERLSHRFAELQWDLGGIAYEMASRDHFRLDVLVKQAAKLQEVDAQLGQVERVLKLEESCAAGTCPSCGALQARGAVFCWQCGKELKPPATPAAEATATKSR